MCVVVLYCGWGVDWCNFNGDWCEIDGIVWWFVCFVDFWCYYVGIGLFGSNYCWYVGGGFGLCFFEMFGSGCSSESSVIKGVL